MTQVAWVYELQLVCMDESGGYGWMSQVGMDGYVKWVWMGDSGGMGG